MQPRTVGLYDIDGSGIGSVGRRISVRNKGNHGSIGRNHRGSVTVEAGGGARIESDLANIGPIGVHQKDMRRTDSLARRDASTVYAKDCIEGNGSVARDGRLARLRRVSSINLTVLNHIEAIGTVDIALFDLVTLRSEHKAAW